MSPAGASSAALLAELGLREPAIRAAFGVATAVHLARLGSRRSAPAETRAAAVVALFVSGARLRATDLESLLGDALGELVSAELLARDGAEVFAPLALLPVEGVLLACPWQSLPDDSSFHLWRCLPADPGRWLDIGTGCAFAPLLARRHRRTATIATEVDEMSLRAARVGLALAGVGGSDERIELRESDLFSAVEEDDFDTITFNAPIEGAVALLERLYAEAPAHLAPGGEILCHSLLSPEQLAPRHGALARCRYTPDGFQPAFGVTLWRPDRGGTRPAAFAGDWCERYVELSDRTPHLQRADLVHREPSGIPYAPVFR